MPWVKLDDELHLNRKIGRLSSDAFRLWTLSLTWSAAEETRGKVAVADLPYIWPNTSPRARDKAKEELVAVGCWELNGDGWVIHDFEEYNPPRPPDRGDRQSQAGTYASHVRWHRNKGERSDECQWCAKPATRYETQSDSNTESDTKRNPKSSDANAPVPDPDPVLVKNSLAEGLTTPREALRAWAELQRTKPTDRWLKPRLQPTQDFLEQHPDLTRHDLVEFLRFAHRQGVAEPAGWPSWWPTWPGSHIPKTLPPCDICDNRRLVPIDEEGKAWEPCQCTKAMP